MSNSIEEFDSSLNFIGPSLQENGDWDFAFSARQYQALIVLMDKARRKTTYISDNAIIHPLDQIIGQVQQIRDMCLARYGMDMIVHSNAWNAHKAYKVKPEKKNEK